MASASHTTYTGVTSDLEQRVWQHKTGAFQGFSSKYKVVNLVYYEEFSDIEVAIKREKQLKKWRREKKLVLIEKNNPQWLDLSAPWFADISWPEE